MQANLQTIPAGRFKAQCLQLMEIVNQQRKSFVITKRGQPIARLVPIEAPSKKSCFGSMKGSIVTEGDLTAPLPEKWGVLS